MRKIIDDELELVIDEYNIDKKEDKKKIINNSKDRHSGSEKTPKSLSKRKNAEKEEEMIIPMSTLEDPFPVVTKTPSSDKYNVPFINKSKREEGSPYGSILKKKIVREPSQSPSETDEIDDLINNYKAKRGSGKIKFAQDTILDFEEIRSPIIDLSKVNNQAKITNSDFLLSMLEIGSSSKLYDLKYSSKSKLFWDEVLKGQRFSKIFGQYASDTLRRYYSILTEVGTIRIMTGLIKESISSIDKDDQR